MAHDIYICYTEQDKSVANEICQAMEQQEISCWLASRDLDSTKPYARSIIEAINNSLCIIVIISSHANKSSQIEYEIDLGYKSNKTILPFIIEEMTINDVLNFYFLPKNKIIAYPNYSSNITNLFDLTSKIINSFNLTNKIIDLLELVCYIFDKISEDEPIELMPFISNGKFGYINTDTMEITIPCKFACAIKFIGKYGLVLLNEDNGYWYRINKDGEILNDYIFIGYPNTEGGHRLSIRMMNKIDIQEKYSPIAIGRTLYYTKNHAIVSKGEHQWGIINPNNEKEIVPFIYDHIYSYDNGYFVVNKGGKLGVVSQTGNEIIPCLYDIIGNYRSNIYTKYNRTLPIDFSRKIQMFENGVIKAIQCNRKESNVKTPYSSQYSSVIEYIFDTQGNIINTTLLKKNRNEEKITNILSPFYQNGKWGYINSFGNIVILCKYDYAEQFSNELAIVSIQKTIEAYSATLNFYGIIDSKGNEIIPLIYNEMYRCKNGLIMVAIIENIDDYILYSDGNPYTSGIKYGFIDPKGTQITPLIYDKAKNSSIEELTTFTNDLIKVQISKGWTFFYGIINIKGKEILSCEYEKIEFKQGLIYATKGSTTYYFDEKGEIIDKLEYRKKNNKYGIYCLDNLKLGNNTLTVKDIKGNTIIPDKKYNQIWDINHKRNSGNTAEGIIDLGFCNVLRIHNNQNYYGYIDSFGNDTFSECTKLIPTIGPSGRFGYKEIAKVRYSASLQVQDEEHIRIPYIYDMAFRFVNGFGRVKSGENYFFVNTLGNPICCIDYSTIHDFSEGRAAVCRKDKGWGFINTKGKEIIPCEYEVVNDFSDGLAIVKKECKYGAINHRGEIIIPLQYEILSNFSEGLAATKINGKWGYINKENKVVIPFIYDYILQHFKEGFAELNKDGQNILIDRLGKEIITEYKNIHPFSEGLAAASKNGKWGYINKNYEVIIPFKYSSAFEFNNGFAIVKSNQKYGVINKNGIETIPCQYRKVWGFKRSIIAVQKNNKWALCAKEGILLTDFIYEKIYPFNFEHDLMRARRESLWGYINEKGEEIVPCNYEEVFEFYHGIGQIRTTENGQQCYRLVDSLGNISSQPTNRSSIYSMT